MEAFLVFLGHILKCTVVYLMLIFLGNCFVIDENDSKKYRDRMRGFRRIYNKRARADRNEKPKDALTEHDGHEVIKNDTYETIKNNISEAIEYGEAQKLSQTSIKNSVCEAIEHGYRIKIEYLSKEQEITERVILPLKIEQGHECDNELVQHSRRCKYDEYLIAFCELRNEERLFKLNRIMKILKEYKN